MLQFTNSFPLHQFPHVWTNRLPSRNRLQMAVFFNHTSIGLQWYSDVIKCISSSYFSTTKRGKYQTWKISYDFFISCFSFLLVCTYKVGHWSFYSNHILRSLFDPELNFALYRLHLHVWVENQMHEKHLLSSRHLPKGLTLKWSKLSIWK